MLKIAVLALVLGVAVAIPTNPLFETNPYVVNGTNADTRTYPYVVSVRSGTSHNCGGSILSPLWVLCAAHCSGSSVQYNATQISSSGSNVVQISRWTRHQNYSSSNLSNDIAVILLASPITLGVGAQPTRIPPQFYEVRGNWEQRATLVGYGLDRTGGSIQTTLQSVVLQVASNAHCRTVHRNTVYDSNICAGVPEGGKGQCSGDSGGPLREDETGYQVGIVSWSEKPCTIAPYPGVYTKVSHFRNWIQTTTGLTLP